MADTFETFMRQFGPADGRYTLVEVGDTIDHWPTVVVRFGDRTAVLQLCGVGADRADWHLSIDIHAFVGDQLARAGVFGMENGKRYEAFGDAAPGTSHGWPAVQGVSVLVGTQTSRTVNGSLCASRDSPSRD
jgi:hypothetical protein